MAAAVTRYRRLGAALPGTRLHYAVKANPEPALLAALARAGSRFDVASPAEVVAALEAGAAPGDLVYSHPVKRRADIAFAARLGVRLFVVDSLDETHKVAATAPGASVLCRISTSGAGADWSLARKFGCPPHAGGAPAPHRRRHGLDAGRASASTSAPSSGTRGPGTRPSRPPPGCSRPSASRTTRSPGCWTSAAASPPTSRAAALRWLPTARRSSGSCAGTSAPTVRRPSPSRDGPSSPTPGRWSRRWSRSSGAARPAGCILDAGVFTGLVETLDEAIRYRLRTSADGGPTGPCVLAGPTCDSTDVLYEQVPVQLPLALAEGDTVRLLSAGAYTTCYSTVGFNGFAPLATRLVG